MFGWITGKIKRRQDDFDDIRSEVLGARSFEPMQPFQQPPQPFQQPQRGYDEFTPRTREVFEPIETPSFGPASFERSPEPQPSRNYEIMDRLNMIESQLAAVRSMTETINERLKNMESRLGLQRR